MKPPKSDLLRKTADEFDSLMVRFERTKKNLIEGMQKAHIKDEVIAEYVQTFDEGKKVIEDLMPIRDNVDEIKKTILTPVAKVIEDTSDTNKKFGWTGIIVGGLGIAFSVVLPYTPLNERTPDLTPIVENLAELQRQLIPTIDQTAAGDIKLVLYDRFEVSDPSRYEVSRLLDAGTVGQSHGFESVGFQPEKELNYRPLTVDCLGGCRVTLEAMVRVVEGINRVRLFWNGGFGMSHSGKGSSHLTRLRWRPLTGTTLPSA